MYEKELEQLKTECLIRNRSVNTARTYTNNLEIFFDWIGDKPLEDLTLADARDFILEKRSAGKSTQYCNTLNATLAFFYRFVLHKRWDIDEVPRMKRDWVLPQVLTLDEIELMIDTATETRNKAIIALMYSSGLRVGEIINLAPSDIYMSTMQVHVRCSKNHGDHWTVLSERALELLKQYWYENPQKRDMLFVSLRKPYTPLRTSGIESMIKKIGKEAGIKNIHPHLLRHSFATHLLEAGVSIQYIQAMLGHRSPHSTQIYMHVSNKVLMGVKSPLDHPQKKKRGRKKKNEQ